VQRRVRKNGGREAAAKTAEPIASPAPKCKEKDLRGIQDVLRRDAARAAELTPNIVGVVESPDERRCGAVLAGKPRVGKSGIATDPKRARGRRVYF